MSWHRFQCEVSVSCKIRIIGKTDNYTYVVDNGGINRIKKLGIDEQLSIIYQKNWTKPKEPDYAEIKQQIYGRLKMLLIEEMARIKHFQMSQNLYSDNGINVSFQAIGWNLHQCIWGFYNNLNNGHISKELCISHGLPAEWMETPENYKEEIVKHMEDNCDYARLKREGLSKESLAQIRKVGANLTPIRKDLARDLISHDESITELQVRLYYPEILENYAIRN